MILNKKIAIVGVVLAFLSVLLGAFAAHGLKEIATAESLQSFTTAVRYQMYHALALLFLSLIAKSEKLLRLAYYFIVLGVLLFSGSIYALTISGLYNTRLGLFALLTPLGGICLLIGWSLIGYWLLKMSQSKSK